MRIKDLSPGLHSDPLEVTIAGGGRVHTQLLRILLKDDTGLINLVIEGAQLCAVFDALTSDTSIRLEKYVVTAEAERLQKYFPPQVKPSGIVEHGTENRLFLLITTETVPEMRLSFYRNSVLIPALSTPEAISLEGLYARHEASPSKAPSLTSFVTLGQLKVSAENGAQGSVYCVVLDCTSSYPVANSTDMLMLLKVTDESVFPDFANVQLFHQPQNPVPKVASYGDIMRLQHCYFKLYKGTLTGTMSAQSKAGKFSLYALTSEELTPYGLYKCTFSPGLDHHRHMLAVRRWAKARLVEETPVLGAAIPLSRAQNSECDVLARVYEKACMGSEELDPTVLFVYEGERATTILIEKNKAKMVKWLASGDTVRIRSVAFDENRLLPSNYTDILKIPLILPQKQVPASLEQEEVLAKMMHFLLPVPGPELISTLKAEFLPFKTAPFGDALHLKPGERMRTRGFIVHILPTSPSEIRGFYCPQCRQFTHQEVCPCGRETEVRCPVTLVLWDGKSEREEELLKVAIEPRQTASFLGEVDWQMAYSRMMNSDSMLDLVVTKDEDKLLVTGTNLRTRLSRS